jgi:hypothetical protein
MRSKRCGGIFDQKNQCGQSFKCGKCGGRLDVPDNLRDRHIVQNWARCGRRFQPLSTGGHVGKTKMLEKMLDLIRAKLREETRRRGQCTHSLDHFEAGPRTSTIGKRQNCAVDHIRVAKRKVRVGEGGF